MNLKQNFKKFCQEAGIFPGVEVKEILFYEDSSFIQHSPKKKTRYFKDPMETEADGIRITFIIPFERPSSKDPLFYQKLAFIIRAYRYTGVLHIPDYEETFSSTVLEDYKNFLIDPDYDDCWHHTLISFHTGSTARSITLEIGFCHCS